jgi:hypothetical protein
MNISLLLIFFNFFSISLAIKDEILNSHTNECDFYWSKSTLAHGGNGIFFSLKY